MKFSPNNFLQFLKLIVCGGGPATSGSTLKSPDGGYSKDVQIPLGDVSLASGTTMTLDGGGLHALVNAASSTADTFGTTTFLVPRDYDQASDIFKIRVVAKMAGATDTPTLTVASSTATVSTSTAIGGTVYGSTYGVNTIGSTVTTVALNNTLSVYEVDLSGQSLKRDSLVSLKISVGVHNTDAVNVYAVEAVYASCIVAWGDPFDRDVLGTYLRG